MLPLFRTAAGDRENQDRGAVIRLPTGTALVVADGAGGVAGGAEAAATAVALIKQKAAELDSAAACATVLRGLDQQILQDEHAGETTCVLAILRAGEIFGASVGDSGAWVIGETHVTDLTQHQRRKPLLGSGAASPVEFSRTSDARSETVLLATDGLLKYAPVGRIAEICRGFKYEDCTQRLIDLVRYPSGGLPDDVTLILASLTRSSGL